MAVLFAIVYCHHTEPEPLSDFKTFQAYVKEGWIKEENPQFYVIFPVEKVYAVAFSAQTERKSTVALC